MAKAAAAGHRVVLITATNGEQGEPKPGVLEAGESLAERRLVELARSAKILGAELLLMGYEDSGMMGEPANDNAACFWQADLDTAAERLAAMLREVDADVLTIYDAHGLYGHPDHIKVHAVGIRAAELIGLEHVYMGTVNRDRALAGFSAMREQLGPDADLPDPDGFAEFGMVEDDLSYEIDATGFVDIKKEALTQHRSQVSPDDFFLAMPDEAFSAMFGWENYAIPGVTGTGGPSVVELLPGLWARWSSGSGEITLVETAEVTGSSKHMRSGVGTHEHCVAGEAALGARDQ